MTQEWSTRNQFNSFNSMKGLLYMDWYRAIKAWRDGQRAAPLPPIEVSLDPIHFCNLRCSHCNSHRYLSETMDEKTRMTNEHIMALTKFLAEWGVKSVCWGGGGEPTLHTWLGATLLYSKLLGLHNSIATNGTAFTDKLVEQSVAACRWIGVSVDAATPATYEVGRKANLFHKTVENIEKLVAEVERTGARCDIAFKFLIFSYNQHEIARACAIAKELGVRDFHARPADFRHQGLGEWKARGVEYDLTLIREQFAMCHEMEDEHFRVFTVTHKFNEDFTPRRDFKGCYASPICIQLCADGNIYLCPDTRHIEAFCLGSHYPDPENIRKVWGSQRHREMVFGEESMKRCTSRCTFGIYNLQAQKLAIEDRDEMCWRFP